MNLENVKLVVDKIKSCPDQFDQRHWHCGTKHCFAGWAQILSGKKANGTTARRDARMFLDLTLLEANHLFSPDRSLADLERLLTVDLAGFDRAGFDRAGFDRAGRDRDGFDRDGFDCDGFDRAGRDRDGFDRDGIDRDGFDCDGLDNNNKPRPEAA